MLISVAYRSKEWERDGVCTGGGSRRELKLSVLWNKKSQLMSETVISGNKCII